MCTRNCLCNTCHKRNKCNDCPYIDIQDTSKNPWLIVCSTTGIQSCNYYIKPPYVHHEFEEVKPIIVNFKNGSSIETLNCNENKRSSRARIYQRIDLNEYHWWQRIYLRFLDSNLVRKFMR
jgi:hypothetical protein